MSLPVLHGHEQGFSSEDRNVVKDHLERVLASPNFAHSHRSQSFLRYIVEETLAGRAEQIKERNIGVDVFGKAESFDPQEESSVRVCASDVRKRLAKTYNSNFGDGIEIEMPVGSYTPRFRVSPDISPKPELAVAALEPVQSFEKDRPQSRRWGILISILAVLSVGIAASGYFYSLSSKTDLDLLWQPFAGHQKPVLIVLPTPAVLELYNAPQLPNNAQSGHFSLDAVHLREGYFTGIGASLGAARFAEQLALRHQQFTLKFGLDASFPDLLAAPTILLGGFSSPLGLKLTQNLRYRLVGDDKYSAIKDTFPNGKTWRTPNYEPTETMVQGYALVTLLHDSDVKQPVLLVAGLTAVDTASAVNFITDKGYFAEFTKNAPKDWFKKNCQIVIHSNDYGHSPGRPELVAWYVW